MAKNKLNISEISPYAKNGKDHPDKQIKHLASIIARIGWREPILVNSKGVIITGHGRWIVWNKYAESMRLKPIWIIDDRGNTIHGGPETESISEDDERMYRLANNKVAESGWVMDLVKDELRILPLDLVDLTGFDSNLILETKEDNPNLSNIGVPQTKEGDIYQLGAHKIICGDSTKSETYKNLLGNEKARLIFTDPPSAVDYAPTNGLEYNTEKYGNKDGKIQGDDRTPEEALIFFKQVAEQLYKYSTDDANIYWWYASRLQPINEQALKDSKWHVSQIVIWLKNSLIYNPGQNYHRIYEPCMVGWKTGKPRYKNTTFASFTELWTTGDLKTFADHLDVWFQKRDNTSKYLHPTQKPIQLAERALKRSSEKGDIVLDAFGGSGSTMIACDQLERQARLIELDPKFVDVIVGRWVKYTGDTSVIKNGEDIQWIA